MVVRELELAVSKDDHVRPHFQRRHPAARRPGIEVTNNNVQGAGADFLVDYGDKEVAMPEIHSSVEPGMERVGSFPHLIPNTHHGHAG